MGRQEAGSPAMFDIRACEDPLHFLLDRSPDSESTREDHVQAAGTST